MFHPVRAVCVELLRGWIVRERCSSFVERHGRACQAATDERRTSGCDVCCPSYIHTYIHTHTYVRTCAHRSRQRSVVKSLERRVRQRRDIKAPIPLPDIRVGYIVGFIFFSSSSSSPPSRSAAAVDLSRRMKGLLSAAGHVTATVTNVT